MFSEHNVIVLWYAVCMYAFCFSPVCYCCECMHELPHSHVVAHSSSAIVPLHLHIPVYILQNMYIILLSCTKFSQHVYCYFVCISVFRSCRRLLIASMFLCTRSYCWSTLCAQYTRAYTEYHVNPGMSSDFWSTPK